ncbi:MAG: SDR family oxidoreductase [Bryobacteraceae bacterium]|nr:SDR family oxidoreductase [Bryobacteraceae bacterium]
MNIRLRPLREQSVVLLGASSGIGRETALQFARRGARVLVAARSATNLESLVREIRSRGGVAVAAPCDASRFDEVQRLAQTALSEFGAFDTWVNLAAVSLYARFEDTTPEEFRRIMEVNLMGQVHGAQAALPHLKNRGGALIFVSSVEARRALPYQSAYAASKHAIKGMVEALRMELEYDRHPVSVTEILPASIDTPFFNQARSKLGVEARGVPPVYPPSAVARAILYAAAHPVREIPVGSAARAIITGEKLSPALMDRLLRPTFESQRTDRPAPTRDNLFEPNESIDTTTGTQGHRPFSAYTWLKTNPTVAGAIAMGLLGAVAASAVNRARSSRERPAGGRNPAW